MLHPSNPIPPTLQPNDKPISGAIPINSFPATTQVSSRTEFVPPPQTQSTLILANNPPTFSGIYFY